MKNAVIYARFSSHAQNEQSIEGQLAECRAFAERNNLRIVREYIDRALTGTTDKRPDFLQMIEDSKPITLFEFVSLCRIIYLKRILIIDNFNDNHTAWCKIVKSDLLCVK